MSKEKIGYSQSDILFSRVTDIDDLLILFLSFAIDRMEYHVINGYTFPIKQAVQFFSFVN
jgi:hypothetical protein